MLKYFYKNAEQVVDAADKISYPGVLFCAFLGMVICMVEVTAIVLVGIVMEIQERIKKFINKVLNKDGGE